MAESEDGRSVGDASVASPRQRLLDAADELFYGQGIRATGVDAILGRADVARKTLYHQFGGKDELVVAYLRRRDERWRDHWTEAIEAREDPRERLLVIFDALGSWEPGTHRPRGCAFVDAQAELVDPDHPALTVLDDHWTAIRERLEALAAEAGAVDPVEVAADVSLLYRGTLTTLMTDPVDRTVRRARMLADRLLST